MNVLDLFSGIGGFSLGLERAGMRTVAFCEIEPYCRAVLKKHWPHVPCYEDVRTLTADRLRSDGIDAPSVIVGGFPCQDLSYAGKGAGIAGTRSGLWSEIVRLARELRPKYLVVENVSALLDRGMGAVLADLAALGRNAEWHCIPASAIGAPHPRDRIWIVSDDASANEPRRLLEASEIWRAQIEHRGFRGDSGGRAAWAGQVEPEPRMVRVADGLSKQLDARLHALGNAVVPQIPEIIGRAIMQAEGLA